MQDFFNALGRTIGNAIRFVVELLGGFFSGISDAARGFVHGLTGALGVSDSVASIVVLVIGLMLLYTGIRALLRRSLVAGVIWLLLGLLVLSWLIS
ncbi:hypothetical protein [Halotalea alkalilenta]|uniref:Uncharacterized protein n=1 Tax=Halotalea alkalilenta TaxID=376489 RepID=A0A172YH24_9GAMM|nr:hypothetical protein [Halotalea alkalilenta]ANF58275.1 hypothetical protein A5892_13015 [Halotalea alkalilenta]